MSNADRIIRLVIAAVIGFLYWKGFIEGTLAYVLFTLAAIFIFTSLVSFCPLYSLVGLNTCKVKNETN